MKKAVVIQSGGMDSAVLLDWVQEQVVYGLSPETILSLGFNYGQRHSKELEAAAEFCEDQGIDRQVVDLSSLASLLKGSSQTDPGVEVPEGHYAAENMKLTVVPNRNMMMLSVAAAVAIGQGAKMVFYGAHAGDHTIYPDCRREFVDATNAALREGNWDEVEIIAPFLDMTKADLVHLGAEQFTDFSMTWTCYKGGKVSCGRCSTCVERLEAFNDAGMRDPLEYLDPDYWRQAIAEHAS